MPVSYSSGTLVVELVSRFLGNVCAQPYSVHVIDPFRRTCENIIILWYVLINLLSKLTRNLQLTLIVGMF
jgi:hypothetical protein